MVSQDSANPLYNELLHVRAQLASLHTTNLHLQSQLHALQQVKTSTPAAPTPTLPPPPPSSCEPPVKKRATAPTTSPTTPNLTAATSALSPQLEQLVEARIQAVVQTAIQAFSQEFSNLTTRLDEFARQIDERFKEQEACHATACAATRPKKKKAKLHSLSKPSNTNDTCSDGETTH